MDRGPVAVVIEFLPLPHRYPIGVLNIGHHLSGFGFDQRIELCADVVGRLLERFQALEESTVVKLDFGKSRIVKIGRLLVIVARTVRPIGDEALGASPRRGVEFSREASYSRFSSRR